jgi:hypothetical protein
MISSYRRSEVVFLLSLTREQAIDLDAVPRDSCTDLRGTTDAVTESAADTDRLPVIARWLDVQRARQSVIADKEAVAILQLRAGGFSERELVRLTGNERLSLRRRWHATIDEILEKLGGEAEEPTATSRIAMCLKCGKRPRVRLSEVKTRIKGGWRIDAPGRHASVCAECLSPELLPRIQGELAQAA